MATTALSTISIVNPVSAEDNQHPAANDQAQAQSVNTATTQPSGNKKTSTGTIILAPVRVGGEQVSATTENTQSYTAPITRSGTPLNLSPRETPQSVTVITQLRLDDLGLTSLNDVMAQTPGLFVQENDSERVSIISRGYTINNFQIDGMLNTFGGSVRTNYDMAVYDRIEVIRGATGLMTGAGDPSGTINLIRKRPTDELQASAQLRYSRWDNWRVEADVRGPVAFDGKIRARAVAVYQEGESFRDFYETEKLPFNGIIEGDLTENTP